VRTHPSRAWMGHPLFVLSRNMPGNFVAMGAEVIE